MFFQVKTLVNFRMAVLSSLWVHTHKSFWTLLYQAIKWELMFTLILIPQTFKISLLYHEAEENKALFKEK